MFAHDLAALLGRPDALGMAERMSPEQLDLWAAWHEIRGPQDARRLDIAADRTAAAVLNVGCKKEVVPYRYWHTKAKKERSQVSVDEQIQDLAEVAALKKLNLERAAELKRKKCSLALK